MGDDDEADGRDDEEQEEHAVRGYSRGTWSLSDAPAVAGAELLRLLERSSAANDEWISVCVRDFETGEEHGAG